MPKSSSALFIGYDRLEALIAAHGRLPLADRTLYTVLESRSTGSNPIINITARVQFIDNLDHVHYWQMHIAQVWEHIDAPEDKRRHANALWAFDVITAYLDTHNCPTVRGQIAQPKDLILMAGHFDRLQFTRASLWQLIDEPAAAPAAA